MNDASGQPGRGVRLSRRPGDPWRAKVRRIDTHAASVFLAGDRALKVKRAVRFPFLDYSTLAKRKQACEAELAVNAPYAPEIYRGVVADHARSRRRAGDRRRRRTPVEWAVEMRRFDETRTLDRLAGEIDEALAERSAAPSPRPTRKRRPVDAAAVDRGARRLHRRARRGVPAVSGDLSRPRKSRRWPGQAAPLTSASCRLLRERGRRGFDPPHPRRSASRQHRADRRQAGAVRRDRVQRHHRVRRRSLRPRLPADGPARARPAAAGEYRVLNRYLAETHRVEDLDALAALAVLPVAARGDPRQGHRGAHGARGRAGAGGDRQKRRAPISPSPMQRHQRRQRRNSSPSAACPAPARRRLARDAGARTSRQCRAPSSCARTSSARRCSASARPTSLPAEAIRRQVDERVYRRLADKARRIFAAGHSAIVDAVFAQAARARRHRRLRRSPPAFRCAGCSSPPIWRPGSPASASRTHDASDADADSGAGAGRATTLARSIGPRSTPPGRRRPHCRGRRRSLAAVD